MIRVEKILVRAEKVQNSSLRKYEPDEPDEDPHRDDEEKRALVWLAVVAVEIILGFVELIVWLILMA